MDYRFIPKWALKAVGVPLHEENEYRGSHEAPDHQNGAPMYDVTLNDIYPDDYYSPDGFRYYSNGLPDERHCWDIVRSVYKKPDAKVRVYRAIPSIITNQHKIAQYEKEKTYILKTGRIPRGAETWGQSRSEYYEWLCEELERLRALPEEETMSFGINSGDWVTPSRVYAARHGKSNLNGRYKIITKTVLAKQLFTEAGSMSEWGYVENPGNI